MDNTAKALNFPQPSYGTTQPIGGAATPEIVFRPSSESVRIPTQQPQQNSQEESLLDRLSRQLKQQRETDALKDRPLIRETTSQHSARELIQPVSIPTGITQMIPQASIPQTSIPQSIPLEPMVQSIPVEPAPEAELGRSTQFPEVFEELSRSIAGDYEPTFQAIEAQVEESLQPVQQQMQRYSDPISAAQSNGLPIDDRHVADRIPRPVLDGLRSIVSQPTTTDGEVLKSY
jgi:hypothetical protein